MANCATAVEVDTGVQLIILSYVQHSPTSINSQKSFPTQLKDQIFEETIEEILHALILHCTFLYNTEYNI